MDRKACGVFFTLYYENRRVSVSDLYDYDLERLIQLRRVPFLPLLYKAMDLLDILANHAYCTDLKLSNIVARRSPLDREWEVRLIDLDLDFCDTCNTAPNVALDMKLLLINNEKARLRVRGPSMLKRASVYAKKNKHCPNADVRMDVHASLEAETRLLVLL